MREEFSLSCETCASRSLSAFSTLTSGEVGEITQVKHCHRFDRGEALFEMGQYPNGMHCVNTGHIKLVRYSPEGREQIIRFAGAGDALGYASLLTGQPYSITAIAVDPTTVCFIPSDLIFRYLREKPQMSLRVMQMMSQELQATQRRIVELARKSVRERVAEALLVLRETFGTEDDGETLNMPLTREEIADIVGTAPESLIRMLSELKSDRLIEIHDRRIRVKNLKALIDVANISD